MKNRIVARSFLAMAVVVIFSGCTSLTKSRTQTAVEIEEQEQRLGQSWARGIEGLIEVRSDALIEEQVVAVASRMGLLLRPYITLFESRGSGSVPAFVLPGNRWYLSLRALKPLKYDNEFAAIVAAAMALSERSESAREFRQDPVGGSAFTIPVYSGADWLAVSARMVELLYSSGFDPRGVPQFWKKMGSGWTGMPYAGTSTLEEDAHQQIARRVPLLNPVVRTREFGEIEKRLRKL